MTTPNLNLPEWQQNQNQPHVPVNTALRILDCLAQLRVQSVSETAPPGSPADGDCYIPASPATGDWAGHENDIAMFISNGWVFRTPLSGWEGWLIETGQRIRYWDGSPAFWAPV